jgi:uncharacterized protein (TIGR00299 family) protein
MTRVAYLDCIGGVAGDMLLAALLDAGADQALVREGVRGLAEGLELQVGRSERHGITACTAGFATVRDAPHRTWSDVRALIDGGNLPERARERAQETFRRLAVAEGRIHGISPDEVQFHEVGALDAIGDVCGVCIALESLDVEEVACSPLPLARGLTQAAHGVLPLPAPATLELMRGVPVQGRDVDAELVTPTGAALVTSLATSFAGMPEMTVAEVGYGAGARDLEAFPNLLRVLVGVPSPSIANGAVSLIEANVDDLSPELVPDVIESCLAAGALDAWTTPAGMKKSRPGTVLAALTRPMDERSVAEAMLRQSTTLGVRITHVKRWELEREFHTVTVEGHEVRVKVGRLDGEIINLAPEHDDCAAVARRLGRPTKTVWSAAMAAAHQQLT